MSPATDLQTVRILNAVVVAAYLAGGWALGHYFPGIHDPSWLRGVLVFLHVAAFAAGAAWAPAREHAVRILTVLLYMATAHVFYLVYANNLSLPLAVNSLIVFFAVTTFLPTRTELIAYFGYVVLLAALAAWQAEALYAPFFMLVYAGLTAFAYFLQHGRLKTLEALGESEARFRTLFEAAAEGLVMHEHGRILDANPAFCAAVGEEHEKAVGRRLADFVAPQCAKDFVKYIGAPGEEPFETVGRKTTGGTFYAEFISRRHGLAGRPVVVTAVRDITDRKRTEHMIADQSHRDPLTDLPTRRVFEDRLQVALAAAKRRDEPVGVLCLEVEGLAKATAEHGNHITDMLLLGAGTRIKRAIRESDTVARYGDARFALLLLASDGLGTRIAAEKLVDAFELPFMVEGQSITVPVSIGISRFPEDGERHDELLRRAEAALESTKEGKRAGSVFAVYGE